VSKSRLAKLLMVLAVFVIAAVAGLATGTASAAGGTSFVYDGYSPNFSPSTIQPGNNTTLTLTVAQDNPSQYGVIVIYGLDQAGLTFVGNGDTSADCYSEDYYGGFVVCEYSDFAHSYKSDSFTFKSDPHQPYGSYQVYDEVYTGGEEDGGYDEATSTIRYAPKPVVPQTNGLKLCYSVNGQTPNDSGMYVTQDTATGAVLMAAGYWAPTAVGFNADGTPILSCQTPQAGGLLNDPPAASYTDNNGDLLVPGQANIVLGDYPVKLAS